jgi:hypothetical protein
LVELWDNWTVAMMARKKVGQKGDQWAETWGMNLAAGLAASWAVLLAEC